MVACDSSLENIIQNIDCYNQWLEKQSLKDVLRWCNKIDGISQVTSFGASGMVMVNELYDNLDSNIPVIFVDTLHHFTETIQFVDIVKKRYNLNLHKFHCAFANSQEEFEEKVNDTQLWLNNIQQYDLYVKVEPLQRALDTLNVKAWITGRRRYLFNFKLSNLIFFTYFLF